MQKILITGGSGTVGKAFIKKYYDNYQFINYSRNETSIHELSKEYPNVKNIIGDIMDLPHLIKTFSEVKPDVIIHAAALKHIDIAEKNPTQAIKLNVMGSHNVVTASILNDISLVVGVSTDKACSPNSVYGYTKKMMEEMFMDMHTDKNRFICTRFANVAGSNGSVIPFWKKLAEQGENLRLTDPLMNRLMFSKDNAAELIHKSIEISNEDTSKSFVLSKKMKTVNLFDLAKIISQQEVDIVGSRPGEKLNETLISENELPLTKVMGEYVLIFNSPCLEEENLEMEYSSLTAEKATNAEILTLINQ